MNRLKSGFSLVKQLAPDCLAIAQGIAPQDTGNLSFNSIMIRYTNKGFQIVYNGNIAPYTEYQQEGTRYFDGNKGFIDATALAITNYVIGQMGALRNNMNLNRDAFKGQSSFINNPARQQTLLRSMSQRVRSN